ncbi:MAG TPA: putative toxin-antitoxin system toxin component, PIN family [Candidatus Sulfopaludibacter sp.]|jgi:putative PIN family toxin of toxin-antitoxin system|nr:putative toxin-antitoxin system toxin component, PIN family [Candidatus Sulfopaludibacter sp.]
MRVVFDSTTVVSALCFPDGRLSWLLRHWRSLESTPLVSRVTAAEVTWVLAYPKLALSPEERHELLAEYLPFCEIVEVVPAGPIVCRDPRDQPYLDLAQSGTADVVVSGDLDLPAFAGQADFTIETPEAYRQRVTNRR